MKARALFASILLLFASPLLGLGRDLGIAGREAPSWESLEWLNLPEDLAPLDVASFRGKVLYIFCFQSWCPGCHSHGFPTLQEVERHYAGNEDVHFVAVQTVFEGYGSNTEQRALDDLADYGLEIPLAHDSGEGRGASPFMRAYRTGGTPWTVIVGPDGRVAWNGFSLKPGAAIRMVDELLPAPPADPAADAGP
ncbi:MAG: TlpA disulfide reductase family protein [Acidobacteriota bacterium]